MADTLVVKVPLQRGVLLQEPFGALQRPQRRREAQGVLHVEPGALEGAGRQDFPTEHEPRAAGLEELTQHSAVRARRVLSLVLLPQLLPPIQNAVVPAPRRLDGDLVLIQPAVAVVQLAPAAVVPGLVLLPGPRVDGRLQLHRPVFEGLGTQQQPVLWLHRRVLLLPVQVRQDKKNLRTLTIQCERFCHTSPVTVDATWPLRTSPCRTVPFHHVYYQILSNVCSPDTVESLPAG